MHEIKVQTFVFEGELPSMNEILDAKRTVAKNSRWNRYNEWKQAWTERIISQAQLQLLDPIEAYPARLSYTVYAANRKKDPDNLISGTVKIIQDALQHAGVLEGDGWKYVVGEDGTTGDAPKFFVDPDNPRVVVQIEEG
uniref:Uncharacterized protein n=1 Tax=viral metagenome TaxID=1070528 RepID=A0A6M3IZV9_9ZZZZ